MDNENVEEESSFKDKISMIHKTLSEEILIEYLKDQRTERRWKTIRRVLISVMIASGLFVYAGTLAGSLGYRTMPSDDAVAVVPISGVIAQNTMASADSVITVLDKMFKSDKVRGIVLLIDSGGGSPTEAERITRFIDREQERTGKRVVAVCASMCASAAYMIAIHTDRVYAGVYSWTGSIGAIMKGWDAHKLLEKFDIDQRVFASGDLKDLMNPYVEMTPAMTEKLTRLVNQSGKTFADEVTAVRGSALTTDQDLFTGEVWTGEESLALGLVDELGTLESVVEREFDGLPSRVYRPKERGNTLFDKVLGNIGRGMAEVLIEESQSVQL